MSEEHRSIEEDQLTIHRFNLVASGQDPDIEEEEVQTATDADVGQSVWAQAQEREVAGRPEPTRRAQYELLTPGARSPVAPTFPSPLLSEEAEEGKEKGKGKEKEKEEEKKANEEPSAQEAKPTSSIRRFGRALVRKMSFLVREDDSKNQTKSSSGTPSEPAEKITGEAENQADEEDEIENKDEKKEEKIGRSRLQLDRPGPLSRLAQGMYHDDDLVAEQNTAVGTTPNVGSFPSTRGFFIHQGLPRLTSQHALISEVSHTDLNVPSSSQYQASQVAGGAYTPSVYSSSGQEHDLNTGVSALTYGFSSQILLLPSTSMPEIPLPEETSEAVERQPEDIEEEPSTQEGGQTSLEEQLPNQMLPLTQNPAPIEGQPTDQGSSRTHAQNLQNGTHSPTNLAQSMQEILRHQAETNNRLQHLEQMLGYQEANGVGPTNGHTQRPGGLINRLRTMTSRIVGTIRDHAAAITRRMTSQQQQLQRQIEQNQSLVNQRLLRIEGELQTVQEHLAVHRSQAVASWTNAATERAELSRQVQEQRSGLAGSTETMSADIGQAIEMLERLQLSVQSVAAASAASAARPLPPAVAAAGPTPATGPPSAVSRPISGDLSSSAEQQPLAGSSALPPEQPLDVDDEPAPADSGTPSVAASNRVASLANIFEARDQRGDRRPSTS